MRHVLRNLAVPIFSIFGRIPVTYARASSVPSSTTRRRWEALGLVAYEVHDLLQARLGRSIRGASRKP